MDEWKGIRVEADVANFPLLSLFRREENRDGNTAQPVPQRRKQRWQHLQLQHTTQLLIYADPLPLAFHMLKMMGIAF